MFTSKRELTENMGVDPDIAAFFVDRPVPKDNKYWVGRYLYVARGTGYLFIPLFFDLQLRVGVPKEILLQENYVQLMENILDVAAKQERNELDMESHLQQIQALVQNRSVQPALLQKLNNYFKSHPHLPLENLGTDNPAMNRGDALLYLLTVLPGPEQMINTIIRYWYLLVPSFLLMDDVTDLHEDQEKQEENALSVYGYDAEGVKRAIHLLETNFQELSAINPRLAETLQLGLDRQKDSTYFKYLLKE